MLQSHYKTKILDSLQKDMMQKNFMNTKLIENGQLGWKYLKHSYSTFMNYPEKAFSINVNSTK